MGGVVTAWIATMEGIARYVLDIGRRLTTGGLVKGVYRRREV